MELLITLFEMIGTISFAFSGALTAMQKEMDIFGTCMLGLTTAVGGGIIRDLLLGETPPAAFQNPGSAIVAVSVSLIVFIPYIRRKITSNKRVYELLMLISDSVGLGIFTMHGLDVAIHAGFESNAFLVIFVAVLTGVGGGVMRDIFAGNRPYIFVKHIYACAALMGAVICKVCTGIVGINYASIIGFFVIIIIRFCSARYRWSLPKSNWQENE